MPGGMPGAIIGCPRRGWRRPACGGRRSRRGAAADRPAIVSTVTTE